MTEMQERSYYEIALTNGQVLIAFAILMTCVTGAFLSGLWVASRAMEGEVVVAEVQPQPPPEGAQQNDFFQQARTQPAPVEAQTEAPRQPAPAERETVAPAREANREAEEPPPEPETTAQPAAPVVESRQPAVVVEEEPAPTSREAATAPSEPVEAEGVLVIQVLTSSEEQQARVWVQRLKDKNYRAYLSPVEVNGKTLYRVRVGPYAERSEAETASRELAGQFRVEPWITTN